MNPVTLTYTLYLLISLALTIWVARTLHRNGHRFLVDCFHGDEGLANSVNHLLVVGFYLVNFGFITLFLKVGFEIVNAREVFEALSAKLGVVLLVLGAMHFFNLFLFTRLRRKALLTTAPPPIPPSARVTHPAGAPEGPVA